MMRDSRRVLNNDGLPLLQYISLIAMFHHLNCLPQLQAVPSLLRQSCFNFNADEWLIKPVYSARYLPIEGLQDRSPQNGDYTTLARSRHIFTLAKTGPVLADVLNKNNPRLCQAHESIWDTHCGVSLSSGLWQFAPSASRRSNGVSVTNLPISPPYTLA